MSNTHILQNSKLNLYINGIKAFIKENYSKSIMNRYFGMLKNEQFVQLFNIHEGSNH